VDAACSGRCTCCCSVCGCEGAPSRSAPLPRRAALRVCLAALAEAAAAEGVSALARVRVEAALVERRRPVCAVRVR
jgi:hypothetical protein